jgi:hypothetical protein
VSRAALFALLAQGAVIALAWILARRRIEHRPFAIWATAMLAGDMARWGIIYTFPWISMGGPFSGARRAVFHLDQALFVFSWDVALVACCWAIFLRRRPAVPFVAGAAATAALIVGYPEPLRGAVLGRFYAGLHLAALLACGGVVAWWTTRRAPLKPEHAFAVLVVLLDSAYFAGPYMLPEPWLEWMTADLIAVSEWCALILLHAAALWGGFLMPSDRAHARPQ